MNGNPWVFVRGVGVMLEMRLDTPDDDAILQMVIALVERRRSKEPQP